MRNDPCIYSITSPSGKRYIGSTVHAKTRKRQHFTRLDNGTHPSATLMAAHKKYGAHNLVFSIVEWCNSGDLIHREQYWIDKYKNSSPGIYNLSLVAGRIEMNDATKAKISKSSTGRTRSDETKRKMSGAKRGYKHTDDAKERMSLAVVARSSSGIKGIILNKRTGKWKVRVDHESGKTVIGTFTSLEDAQIAKKNADDIIRRGGVPTRPATEGVSGIKGVSWHGRSGKWRACPYVNKRKVHLGYFNTVQDAAEAIKKYLDPAHQPMP